MVCGSFYLPGTMVPPPGCWVPGQLGMNGDCVWQAQQGGFDAWAQPSMAWEVVPAGSTLKVKVVPPPRSNKGNSSVGSNTQRVQSAARAAKRQRGRERRKLYRAAAHEDKCSQTETEREKQARLGFEARSAAVAAEFNVVVKHTFIDVDDSEDLSSDEDQMPLPPTFFESSGEIDGWRRDYRRFRLGHHHGAKGEVTANDLVAKGLQTTMAWLDSLELSRPLAALTA